MKRSLPVLIMVILALSSCGIAEVRETIAQQFASETDDLSGQNSDNTKNLSQEEVTQKIYEALRAGKTEIDLECVVDDDLVQNTIYELRYDCPEVFWASGYNVTTDYKSSVLSCDTVHGISEDEIADMSKKLQKAADEVAASVDSDAPDHEKLMQLHDKLIEICDYDYDVYDSTDIEEIGFSGTAYGCLVDHKAVCEGYAEAFSLVSRKLGFESGMVCGTAENEKHAWNYVKVDGEYYWIDVTWDENATESEAEFVPKYKFFLLDDERFMRDRSVDSDVPFVPECTSMQENYYVYNGLYLEEYDFDEVNTLMGEHTDKGGIDLMFADRQSYDAAMSDLLDNGNIWNTYPMLGGFEPSPYYADPDYLTLTMGWE